MAVIAKTPLRYKILFKLTKLLGWELEISTLTASGYKYFTFRRKLR